MPKRLSFIGTLLAISMVSCATEWGELENYGSLGEGSTLLSTRLSMTAHPVYISEKDFGAQGLVVISFRERAGAFYMETSRADLRQMLDILCAAKTEGRPVDIIYQLHGQRILSVKLHDGR